MFYAHPSAVIDDGCLIGAGTKVWHFCHVMPGAKIGENCSIGQNVFIASEVILGNNVKVQNNVSIYTGVECADDVFLGPSMVFTNVINPRAFVDRKAEFRITRVMRGASLGANCTIVCGVTIGRYALIGAGAVVTHDVADFELVTGVPARRTGWVSRVGERLNFSNEVDNTATCPRTGERYRLMDGMVAEVSA